MDKQELSAKKEILKTLMKCPHRKLEETIPVFKTALQNDPLFAGKCFYALTLEEFNKIRDLEESGISFLLTSPHSEHREAGRVLFQDLPPFRAYRVAKFIKESLNYGNRQSSGAVKDYLKVLEKNERRFDGAAKVAAKDLRWMYEFYHINMNPRAFTILYEHKVPEGEIDVIELLRNTEDPNKQAEIIVANKVPYRQATSVIKQLTPAIWVALIEVMSVAEAVNARASVEASGILNDATIRELYEKKLAKAATDKKVSTSTLGERKSVKGKDENLNRIIAQAQETKFDTTAGINEDILLAVDTSGSMHEAIELVKKIGPYIAKICKGKLDVISFKEDANRIDYGNGKFEGFQKGFNLVRPNGQTSLGIALQKSIRDGFTPDICIYITDQGENHSPELKNVYQTAKADIRFIFINIPTFENGNRVAEQLERLGADVSEFTFDTKLDEKGWQYAMDNFVPLLTKGGYADLVQKIMDLELPKRS